MQKLLVLAEVVGHCRWPSPLQKLLVLAEGVGPYRSCWSLQKVLDVTDGFGHCRRCWSLTAGGCQRAASRHRGCGIPAPCCSTSTKLPCEPGTVPALSPVAKRREQEQRLARAKTPGTAGSIPARPPFAETAAREGGAGGMAGGGVPAGAGGAAAPSP